MEHFLGTVRVAAARTRSILLVLIIHMISELAGERVLSRRVLIHSAWVVTDESIWSGQMKEKITVELDSKWERRVNSPLFWAVSALTGISITYAPFYLYRAGQDGLSESSGWLVPTCFAVIYLVPLFYIRLGAEVIKSIHAQRDQDKVDWIPLVMNRLGRLFRRLRNRG